MLSFEPPPDYRDNDGCAFVPILILVLAFFALTDGCQFRINIDSRPSQGANNGGRP